MTTRAPAVLKIWWNIHEGFRWRLISNISLQWSEVHTATPPQNSPFNSTQQSLFVNSHKWSFCIVSKILLFKILRILLKQNTALLSIFSLSQAWHLNFSQLFDDLGYENHIFSESISSRKATLLTTLITWPPDHLTIWPPDHLTSWPPGSPWLAWSPRP